MYHFRYILKNEHNTNVNIQSGKTKDNLKYESYQHIPHRLRKQTHASLTVGSAKIKGRNYVGTSVLQKKTVVFSLKLHFVYPKLH